MNVIIRLPRICDYEELIGVLAKNCASDEAVDALVFEIPTGGFLTTPAVALLGAWGILWGAKGRRIEITGDSDVCNYLSRMNLFDVLKISFVEVFQRHPEAGRFIPLTLVDDNASCKRAVDSVCDLIIHQCDNARDFLPAVEWSVNETVDNILRHADASVPGVVCAQYFPAMKRLDVSICDMGCGLKASLQEAMELPSHSAAIAKAIQRGVTRNPEVGQGNGLAGTLEIANSNGGQFHLWTGNAVFRVNDQQISEEQFSVSIPGTGLYLSLDTNRPVDLLDTWIGKPSCNYLESEAERLSESDGIRVLENCAYTGTRSSAEQLRRKVLSLLPDLDAPLVFDFTGVKSASSSFLDELLGKLARELGAETFRRRIRIVHASARLQAMANVVIGQRLVSSTLSVLSTYQDAGVARQQISSESAIMRSTELNSSSIIDRVSACLAGFEGLNVLYDPPCMEATPGRCDTTLPPTLNGPMAEYIVSQFPSGLYTHQQQAVEKVLQRHNTVVATRTSSGKSLIYSLPVLNNLLENPSSTSLFLYPLKALANDQHLKLRAAIDSIPALAAIADKKDHFVSRYDGSTPDDQRQSIRSSVQLLLTNPDMLHFALLQWHEKHWQRFFSNLSHVIIDECHEYRGIFGTNVAYILRRLNQLCRKYGSQPTFIATSATVSEPKQHLELLTGLPFDCIGPDKDGSQQGRRKFWLVDSDQHYYDCGRKLTLQLAEQGLSVLTFCQSRTAVERLMSRSGGDNRDFVRVYRSGLSPQEREDIELGLRNKTVRAVFTTSALELGIDIGAIDVVICIGLPHSMMSLWQRAGRAARAGKEGAIVLIPASTPIDSYYANHPEEFFARDHEPLVLNMTNRRVVHQHYACAVAENYGDEEQLSAEVFGSAFETVRRLRLEGRLNDEIFYDQEPHMQTNIRSMGEGVYSLEERSEGTIGEIDSLHLLREAYRNAIYRHGGKAFRVQAIRPRERRVQLRREYTFNDTTPFIQTQIRAKRFYKVDEYCQLTVATVGIDAKEFLVNVVEKDRSGKTVQSWPGNSGMRPYSLPTDATLLRIHRDLWISMTNDLGSLEAKSALQSCERLLCSLFPTVAGPCDTQDFSSASQILKSEEAEIYLYDQVYGGADLAVEAFDRILDLLEHSKTRLDNCCCTTDEGCFRCIDNPREDEVTSKLATLRFLKTLIDTISLETPRIQRNEFPEEDLLSSESTSICPTCQVTVSPSQKFCMNCGQKLGDD